MDQHLREFLRRHWQEVEAQSGQDFNLDLLTRTDFIYDTEPACRAVIAVRETAPEKALSYFQSVQRAFYVDNEDTNDERIYVGLAEALGLDGEAFVSSFVSAAMRGQTKADFDLARRMRVSGFPSLLIQYGEYVGCVCTGYTPAQDVLNVIDGILSDPATH